MSTPYRALVICSALTAWPALVLAAPSASTPPSNGAAFGALTLSLPLQGSGAGPGGGILKLDDINDSRCRAAERCGRAAAASRDAVVQLTVQSREGSRYAATLALGAAPGQPSRSAPASARMGDWLVELLAITPEGRELPSDGPAGRPQTASLRVTPADRVALGVGAAADLPRAGARLRVLSIDDHRCPPGVACGVVGYVQVETEISALGVPAERMTWGAPTDSAVVRTWRGHDIAWCGVPRPRGAAGGGQPPLQAEFFVGPASGQKASAPAPAGAACSPALP